MKKELVKVIAAARDRNVRRAIKRAEVRNAINNIWDNIFLSNNDILQIAKKLEKLVREDK